MSSMEGKSKGVAAAVYGDTLAPAAQEIGSTLGKLVRLGLLPVNFALDSFEEAGLSAIESARARLRSRKVDPSRIVVPPPEVSIPVVQALQIRGGDVGIRDLYLNPLASAMDSETQRLAHPAFSDIIRQLTPLEAKVIALLSMGSTMRLRSRSHVSSLDGTVKRERITILASFTQPSRRESALTKTWLRAPSITSCAWDWRPFPS